jgi:putative nucleotidyltransferase with HDIG domain
VLLRHEPRRSELSGLKRCLPHAVLATAFVMVLPALAVWVVMPAGSPALLLVSVPLAMALSVGAATAGAAIWMRRPPSRDVVFADLMLWGWLRRFRTERRLAEAREVLGRDLSSDGPSGLSRGGRVEALTSLGALLEARDAYTHGHSGRVTRHAERIAEGLGLVPADVAKIRTAAALHDVGKVHTPRDVLNKPGRLTDQEFAVIRRHPVDGAEMLSGIGDSEITAMVRHHHERMDGAGYPDGLSGDEIPLGARIIAVADTFDAMTSCRSYRRACGHDKALAVLSEEAGTQLDAAAVSAFLGYYSGRRSVAWSALVAAAPQRIFGWLGSAPQGLGTGAVSVAQILPAIGAAALLAGASGNSTDATGSPRAGHTRFLQVAAPGSVTVPAGGATAAASGSPRRELVVSGRRTRSGAGRAPVAPDRSRRPSSSDPAGSHGGTGDPPTGSSGTPEGAHAPSVAPAPALDSKPARPGLDPTPEPDPGSIPEDEGPGVEIPHGVIPAVEVPDLDIPHVEIPAVEVPDIVIPHLEVPPVDVDLPPIRTR